MTEQTPDAVVERFDATSGRAWGVVGLVIVAAVTVVWLVEGERPWLPVVSGGLLLGGLMWAALLRPRVWVTESHVVLRGMVDTVHVPLAAVGDVVVGQVLAVRVGDRRFVSAAVGRGRRAQRTRPGRAAGVTGARDEGLAALAGMATLSGPGRTGDGPGSYADFVQGRLVQHAERARADAGIRVGSAEQAALATDVHRERAWPQAALLATLAVVFVASLAR